MKRCPQCGREYDLTMSFCLDDGSELLYGPATVGSDKEETMLVPSHDFRDIHQGVPSSEAPTRRPLSETQRTEVLHKTGLGVRRNTQRIIAALVIVLGLMVGGTVFYRYVLTKRSAAPQFEKISLSRVTNEGNVELAAVSPDGKYIAYLTVDGSVNSFWTLHLATNSRVKIAAPTKVIPFIAPTFSPDGNYVYFSAENETDAGITDIYRVPVLGGPPRKALSDVQSGPSFSPDGSRMAFSRYANAKKESSIMISNVDGSGERTLTMRAMPRFVGARGVAWSPRGDLVAFDIEDGIGSAGIGVVKAEGGDIVPVTTTPWSFIGNLQWLRDQSGIVCAAQLHPAQTTRIWKISFPGGSSAQVTDQISNFDPSNLSVTSDGTSLLVVNRQAQRKISLGPADTPGTGQNISSTSVWKGQAWDASGRLYYTSVQEGRSQVWQTNSSGAVPNAVAEIPIVEDLTITPDGKFFVFLSEGSGTWQLWRTDADGGNPKQLTEIPNIQPGSSMSPDGKWIFFSTFDGAIWKIGLDGGDPMKISTGENDDPAFPQLSPDGKMLAYTAGFHARIVIAAYDGQTARLLKKFDLPVNFYGLYRWAPDGRAIVYVDNAGPASDLWRQPIDGGPAKKITDSRSDMIANFSYSPDGKYIAVTRGPTINDAVLIRDAGN